MLKNQKMEMMMKQAMVNKSRLQRCPVADGLFQFFLSVHPLSLSKTTKTKPKLFLSLSLSRSNSYVLEPFLSPPSRVSAIGRKLIFANLAIFVSPQIGFFFWGGGGSVISRAEEGVSVSVLGLRFGLDLTGHGFVRYARPLRLHQRHSELPEQRAGEAPGR